MAAAPTAPERAADYHASTGFSSTIARTLITRTPAHAKAQADGHQPATDAMDMGTAVHQLLLRDDRVEVADYPDYRTKDAREWRDGCRESGRVPLLRHKWEEANHIAQAVRQQLADLELDPTPFTEGTAEHVLRWQDHRVECRAMLDWLRDDHTLIDDLKTTNDASPRGFQRKVWSLRYDIQAAFYTRAVQAVHGTAPAFRWVAVETEYPYLVTVHQLEPAAVANAERRVEEAILRWRTCTETNTWPGFTRDVNPVGPVPWEKDAWADLDVDYGEVPF